MKTYGGVDIKTQAFLTSAVVGSEWSASRPDCFTPEEGTPCAHLIGGWVGPRSCSMTRRSEHFLPCRDSNSDHSIVQPVASRYTD
jgi:hypothetical protein